MESNYGDEWTKNMKEKETMKTNNKNSTKMKLYQNTR